MVNIQEILVDHTQDFVEKPSMSCRSNCSSCHWSTPGSPLSRFAPSSLKSGEAGKAFNQIFWPCNLDLSQRENVSTSFDLVQISLLPMNPTTTTTRMPYCSGSANHRQFSRFSCDQQMRLACSHLPNNRREFIVLIGCFCTPHSRQSVHTL